MGIANTPIQQVPLVNVLANTWGTQDLRHLSQGLPIFPVLFNNCTEAVFFNQLKKALWDMDIDIHDLADKLWDANPKADKPTSDRVMYNFVKPITDLIATQLKTKYDELSEDQQSKIEKLQEKIKELQAAQKTPPLSPAVKRKADQEPAEDNTLKRLKVMSPSKAFKPTSHRPLALSTPTNTQSQAITAWLNKLKAKLDPNLHKTFDGYIKNVLVAWTQTDKKERPSIRDIAAQWGLPVSSAASFTEGALLKISAAAAFQVSTLAETTA